MVNCSVFCCKNKGKIPGVHYFSTLQEEQNYKNTLENKNLSTPQQGDDVEDNMKMYFVDKENFFNFDIEVTSTQAVESAAGTMIPDDEIEDVKLEDMDIKQQFVDQHEIHDRKTFLERSESESKDFILIKMEENSLDSSNISTPNPDVEVKELKHEDVDIEEQFIDENGRETFIHKSENIDSSENNDGRERELVNVSRQESVDSNICENYSDGGRNSKYPSDHNGNSCEDKSSVLQDEMRQYTVKFHSKRKIYHCGFCEYASHQKCRMTGHIEAVHLKKKKYQCPVCGYGSWYRTSFKVHVESIHMKIKDFKCHLCDYECSTKGSLKLHVESVHLNKKYQCHLCGYSTPSKRTLKNHIESFHLNIKKHQCKFCDYATSLKYSFKTHTESIHLNMREHRCHLCDYRAVRKWALAHHIKTFHLAKKYPCHLCDYATHYKGDLKSHTELVHPIMKYQCSFCDYRARYKGTLKSHEDSVHWS